MRLEWLGTSNRQFCIPAVLLVLRLGWSCLGLATLDFLPMWSSAASRALVRQLACINKKSLFCEILAGVSRAYSLSGLNDFFWEACLELGTE